jgi:hypothetical protein
MTPILVEVVMTHLEVRDSSIGWRDGGTDFMNDFLYHSKGTAGQCFGSAPNYVLPDFSKFHT